MPLIKRTKTSDKSR